MDKRQQEFYQRMIDHAHSKGGELLSDRYINQLTEYKWRCKCSYEWTARWKNIYAGTWCPKCAAEDRINKDKTKKDIQEIRELAIKMGGKLISETYINSHEKLLWECGKGHIFDNTRSRVSRGKWCRFCNESPRATIEDCRKTAHERNGLLLS